MELDIGSAKQVAVSYRPAEEIAEILRPAYRPCDGFEGGCKGVARWDPASGNVPRGFVGAFGYLTDVEVIILLAEPGNPHSGETYSGSDKLETTCAYTFEALRQGQDLFHRNLRYLLGRLFPGLSLEDQLRRAWVTETYLCSAPREAGPVDRVAEKECATRYLARQLDLLRDRPVIALGGKAHGRARRVPAVRNLKKAYAVSPPGCNHRPARPSWDSAADWARSMFKLPG